MTEKPPYMNGYGHIPKVLEAIKKAPAPPRFTQDFLKTKLNIKASGARPIIPMLKKLEFLNSDGTPTDRYNQFRNPSTAGSALAEGIKKAYHQLYESNEYLHDLNSEELKGLVTSVTGAEPTSNTVGAIVGSFNELIKMADFNSSIGTTDPEEKNVVEHKSEKPNIPNNPDNKLNLSYTINLNLPDTTDIEVYNAIFKSLKEHIVE